MIQCLLCPAPAIFAECPFLDWGFDTTLGDNFFISNERSGTFPATNTKMLQQTLLVVENCWKTASSSIPWKPKEILGQKVAPAPTKALCERLDAARLIRDTFHTLHFIPAISEFPYFSWSLSKVLQVCQTLGWSHCSYCLKCTEFNISVRFSESIFDAQSIAATSFLQTQAVTAASCSIGTCGQLSTSEANCKWTISLKQGLASGVMWSDFRQTSANHWETLPCNCVSDYYGKKKLMRSLTAASGLIIICHRNERSHLTPAIWENQVAVGFFPFLGLPRISLFLIANFGPDRQQPLSGVHRFCHADVYTVASWCLIHEGRLPFAAIILLGLKWFGTP